MARARVLVVAGSDSGGGAGFQADCKVITALGGYASCALTAVTAQNTLGVHGVFAVPAAFVRAQMRAVLEDIGTDAVKSGMLGEAAVVSVVAEELRRFFSAGGRVPYVLDPVMVAKGGAPLLAEDAVEAVRRELVPLADLVTPNLPEAEALTGETDGVRAGEALVAMGARAALVKGGHGEGREVVDVLVWGSDAGGAARTRVSRFRGERIETRHTHGTGCALASTVAVLLAGGVALEEAVARGLAHVRRGILQAPGFGAGHGPLEYAPE